jgi:hypothetical protein
MLKRAAAKASARKGGAFMFQMSLNPSAMAGQDRAEPLLATCIL